MKRILLAFRGFFGILFSGKLSDETAAALGLSRKADAPPPAPTPPPAASASDGALQLLAILQRDSRLLDFLMEDISGYADDQVGAAVRELHGQCREALRQYLKLAPVIDGVEGTFARIPASDPFAVKLIGNVPAQPPAGGILRHKGWRAASVQLPPLNLRQDLTVIAPAEIEIE